MNPRRLLPWWRALTQRRRFEAELDAEFDFHLQARCEDLVAQGLAPAEARRRARIELGMGQMHRHACRQARGIAGLDTAWRDLRYAARGLVRNPGYSITAVLVLAIALAANALLFTLFSAYALRSPPVAELGRWVTLEAASAQGSRLPYWTTAEADALVATPSDGLEGAYLLREARLTVSAAITRRASGESVSDNYFELLGVHAARGRTFRSGERQHRPVVLSHVGWQRLLGEDPEPIGRSIELAGEDFTVIGVMPPQFTGTTPLIAMYWLRDRDYRGLQPGFRDHALGVELSGLLRADVSPAAASAALTALAQQWNGEREEWARVARAEVAPRRAYLPPADVDDAIRAALPIALAFVLVLLIAAANLANLVLARFASRRRELAVRVAIGAPRRRLVAQLLVECALLASVAAVLAAALAWAVVGPVQQALYTVMDDAGFDLIPIRMEPGVLAYSWVLAMLSSLAFGALPAMAATAPWRRGGARPDLTALQRSSGARLRSALMVGQLAASVVLLVLAGLIASNAREVARTEFGFDPARTIAVHAWPPTTQLVRALEALPQVHRVAAVSAVPLTGGAQRVHARIGARSEPLHVRAANAEFFDVFGIQSVHGRALHRADEGGAMVAVVSRRTAELLWPGQDPLGRTLELPPDDPPGSMPSGTFEVVGVVEDVVSNSFVQGIDPTAVYVPAKVPHAALGSLVVHSVDSAPATQQAIMEACVRAAAERNCELMPLLLAIKFQRLPFLAASVAAASLGWIALAISCIGLYGLVSYVVVQKRREIGVRVALGARGTTVVREVLAGSVRQVGLGVAIGLPLAFALTRVVAAHTDSLRTFDVASFVAIPLALAAVALLAAWLPARRSARIAPTEALRLD